MDDTATRLKPYKKDFGYSYTLGVFPTLELINNRPEIISRIVLSSKGENNQGIAKILDFAKKSGIPALFDDKTINRISPKENCFAAAVFDKYSCRLKSDTNHLVLVNPADKGNLGTILRTATAFGIENIAIVSPAADIYDPKVVRASMGALFHVDFCYYNFFEDYQQEFCGIGRNLIPFMLDGEPINTIAGKVKAAGLPFSLIYGNESSGLPAEFLSIGTPARIMHSHNVDSLNLPMAVGIGLYTFTEFN